MQKSAAKALFCAIILSMKLSRKFEQALVILATATSLLVFATLIELNQRNTFADSENPDTYLVSEDHFVTIFDAGNKLTVKTDAKTVADVLNRAGITLNTTDHIEPELGTAIDMDNFHINIYRSYPVVLIDGAKQIYTMTASYDPRTIMEGAGIVVYDGDEIIPYTNNKFLEVGIATAYKIIRNGGRTITIETEIPFKEQNVKDYNLAPGTSEVRQLGELGAKKLTYNVLYVDGEEISRELISEEIIKNPIDRIVATGAPKLQSTSSSENEEITWNYLLSHGFSTVQAAGIMGNLQQEHGFRTSDTAGGLGIAQWTGGRRARLLAKADPYNIYTQLDYLMEELNGGYSKVKAALLSSATIEDATRIFQNQFERCGICRESNRIGYAYSFYERYAK